MLSEAVHSWIVYHLQVENREEMGTILDGRGGVGRTQTLLMLLTDEMLRLGLLWIPGCLPVLCSSSLGSSLSRKPFL